MKWFSLFLLCLSGCVWKDRFDLHKEYAPIESPVALRECWIVDHVMVDGTIERMWQCALSLPSHSTHEYRELVHFVQAFRPGYTVALVHEDEELRGDVARTGMHYEGLRVYMVRQGGSKKLFNERALAPWNKKDQYAQLKKFIKENHDDYEVLLVKEHEKVPGGEWTPFLFNGFRVWVIKAGA